MRAVSINNMCAVFAESEVISLLAREVPAADVAAGLIEAIAGRTATLVRRLGRPELLAVCGGVSLNSGVVQAVARSLDVPVAVPGLPQHTAALGVALVFGLATTALPYSRLFFREPSVNIGVGEVRGLLRQG